MDCRSLTHSLTLAVASGRPPVRPSTNSTPSLPPTHSLTHCAWLTDSAALLLGGKQASHHPHSSQFTAHSSQPLPTHPPSLSLTAFIHSHTDPPTHAASPPTHPLTTACALIQWCLIQLVLLLVPVRKETVLMYVPKAAGLRESLYF